MMANVSLWYWETGSPTLKARLTISIVNIRSFVCIEYNLHVVVVAFNARWRSNVGIAFSICNNDTTAFCCCCKYHECLNIWQHNHRIFSKEVFFKVKFLCRKTSNQVPCVNSGRSISNLYWKQQQNLNTCFRNRKWAKVCCWYHGPAP